MIHAEAQQQPKKKQALKVVHYFWWCCPSVRTKHTDQKSWTIFQASALVEAWEWIIVRLKSCLYYFHTSCNIIQLCIKLQENMNSVLNKARNWTNKYHGRFGCHCAFVKLHCVEKVSFGHSFISQHIWKNWDFNFRTILKILSLNKD